MKKAIPVIIAIALICVVALVNFGNKVEEKYSYGTETADLKEYFNIEGNDDVPVILQDERILEKGRYIDGYVYFDTDFVKKYLTGRFYVDEHEKLLLYTNATTTIRAEIDAKEYLKDGERIQTPYKISVYKGDVLYIAADYVRLFVNYSYEFFENPYRVQMYTEWGEKVIAGIKKDTEVRWRGGVKSEILTSVFEGEVVEILEEMDEWTKVKTDTAFIGYVPNDTLETPSKMKERPVKDVPAEEYSSMNLHEKINMIWHNIEYPQDGPTLFKACAYIKSVNVISPTWYWLTDNDGSFASVASEDYVSAAHRMGMYVWPLISNFHSDTDVDLYEVISYTSKREKLINDLILETKEYGADGINVDFENVPSKTADAYIQFIRELSLACHKVNLVVSVDNYVPSEYTAHYNREEQGRFADYVIIMGYDEHYVGSEIGSVSSIPWMKEGIENTLKVVPKEKVINAIPFYTRVWKTENGVVSSEAVEMEVANNFLKKYSIKTTYDEATNQNYGETTANGIFYQVWMEDADSVKVRLNVMNTLDIAGVAAWRLGQETRNIWDIIESYMME